MSNPPRLRDPAHATDVRWTTSTADRSTNCANSCLDDSHSPAAMATGEAAASLA
jgi:hypothetical protein